MNVYDIMDEIEHVLERGLLVPMKKNSVIINAGELRELLEQLRDNLPQEIIEAKDVLEQRDHILASANAQAKGILVNAEENRKQLIANSEIIRAAESKARTILLTANSKAADLTRASMSYVENNLKEAEDSLAKVLQAVHTTRQTFSERNQK